jgi:hypothetical protein
MSLPCLTNNGTKQSKHIESLFDRREQVTTQEQLANPAATQVVVSIVGVTCAALIALCNAETDRQTDRQHVVRYRNE